METVAEYKSLNDIKLRRDKLRDDILKEDQKIRSLWGDLFHSPGNRTKNTSPSQRISGIINTGASVFDGVILGWKLYRKFRP